MRKVYGAAFVGTVGIPNRYGGFESFVENIAPLLVEDDFPVAVSCYHGAYNTHEKYYNNVTRIFLRVSANGPLSVVHDFIAFLVLVFRSRNVIVLGTSAGLFFPLMRVISSCVGSKLIINLDGIEWRRSKYRKSTRAILYIFDLLAQLSAETCIYDNKALKDNIKKLSRKKSVCIEYSGDHVVAYMRSNISTKTGTALTVCRIEPENNIHILIEGVLMSDSISKYWIIGNWNDSDYSRQLKNMHSENPRICCIDPVYDPVALNSYRQSAQFYLHGHSVGGSNPSLIEMLFYNSIILCFDCIFNRVTAASSALYFTDAKSLGDLLGLNINRSEDRSYHRKKYSQINIASEYKKILKMK